MAIDGYGGRNAFESVQESEKLMEKLRSISADLDEEALTKVEQKGRWIVFNHLHQTGKRKEAREVADMILKSLHEYPDHKFELGALGFIGQSFHADGDLEGAEVLFDRMLEIYDPKQHAELGIEFGCDPWVSAMINKALTQIHLGFPDTAVKMVDKAVEYGIELGFPITKISTLIYKGLMSVKKLLQHSLG